MSTKETAYSLEARQLHRLPNIDSYTGDELMEIANYFAAYSPRHISINPKSRTVVVNDHQTRTRLSISRWLHMTVRHQRKTAGKLGFENGNLSALGEYPYRPIIRLGAGKGQPKYRQPVNKWILKDQYPKSSRQVFYVDGDHLNLAEANVIPWPYSSFLPGLQTLVTTFPMRKFWDCVDYETGQAIQGDDELALYELLAGEGATLKASNKRVTGEDIIDVKKEWWKLQERAKALDAIHDTSRGVQGWFTDNGRRANGLAPIN
jgi:hypothetical protein